MARKKTHTWEKDPLWRRWRAFEEFRLQEKKPREIEHVVWDADDTIWEIAPYGLASFCKPPFTRISEDFIEGRTDSIRLDVTDINLISPPESLSFPDECQISLKPTMRDTLTELEQRGITSSIVSMNVEEDVVNIIDAFGLRDRFVAIKGVDWNKNWAIQGILDMIDVKPYNTIFVDDNSTNLISAKEHLGILPIQMDNDIAAPIGVLRFIRKGNAINGK